MVDEMPVLRMRKRAAPYHDKVTRMEVELYRCCCQCGSGPCLDGLNPSCLDCTHQWCSNCPASQGLEALWPIRTGMSSIEKTFGRLQYFRHILVLLLSGICANGLEEQATQEQLQTNRRTPKSQQGPSLSHEPYVEQDEETDGQWQLQHQNMIQANDGLTASKRQASPVTQTHEPSKQRKLNTLKCTRCRIDKQKVRLRETWFLFATIRAASNSL